MTDVGTLDSGTPYMIMERLEGRIRDGYQYGDYQFTTDARRDSFLHRGICSCYQPVPFDTPLTCTLSPGVNRSTPISCPVAKPSMSSSRTSRSTRIGGRSLR